MKVRPSVPKVLFSVATLLLVGCGEKPRVALFPPESKDDIARGRLVYQQTCATCHGQPEKGKLPAMPPLEDSKVVREDSGGLVRAIMFNPGHRDPTSGQWVFTALSDADIARVANHLRRPVLGGALPVQSKTVARERANPPGGRDRK